MVFKNAIVLMKLTGLLEWSTKSKIKKYASLLYMVHMLFCIIYIGIILIWNAIGNNDLILTLKIVWRVVVLFMNSVHLFSMFKNSNLLKEQFKIEDHILDFKNIIEKRVHKKISIFIITYAVVLILISLQSIIRFYFSKSIKIEAVEDYVVFFPLGIKNPITLFMFKFYTFINVLSILLIYFGLESLAIFLLHLIQLYLEQLKNQINNLDSTTSEHNDNGNLRDDIKRCIVFHQSVLK